jgi:HEAT repeat protein
MPLVRSSSLKSPPAQASAEKIEHDLVNGTSGQRWDAARAASGLPNGLQLLSRAMAAESEPRVREAILTSLARIGTPECAEAVLSGLRSDDAQLRTESLDALRAMPVATGVHLPRLLRDGDADVRVLACDLVRGQPAAQASSLLRQVLAHDSEANVCAAAMEVLAETGGPGLLPLLVQCGARFPDDPFLAFAIRAAGERLGGQH